MKTALIREKAEELGFDCLGVAPARTVRHASSFHSWLEHGYQAEMQWLNRRVERRLDPREVVPGARSVVLVGRSYFTENPDPRWWDDPLRGRVARYAWGPDYHDVLLPPLLELKRFIEHHTPNGTGRAYVDTGPLLERTWAADAGLGFIGKNSLLIDPHNGSYCMLGGIITELELDADGPAEEEGAHRGRATCGQCQRCREHCPTDAIVAPYTVDARRCIAYWTIEHRGDIPDDVCTLFGSWIFGCDACQEVCPYVRRFSKPGPDHFLAFDPERFAPLLPEVVTWDDAAFRARYRHTPVWRTKRTGFLRNAVIALGNSGQKESRAAIQQAAQDADPVIARQAVRALRVCP